MKSMLKVLGTKRLKLKHDKPLSSFAFNFNLRRYIVDVESYAVLAAQLAGLGHAVVLMATTEPAIEVGRCRSTPGRRERERDASTCMRRHQASALAPVTPG